MRLKNYSLKIGDKLLFIDANEEFKKGRVNHILGKNGTGKSSFAKSLIGVFPYKGRIEMEEVPSLLGSYSNVPGDLRVSDLIGLSNLQNQINLIKTLEIDLIDRNLKVNQLSDGQKQKMKLMYFLKDNPRLIVLDEFTNALDKSSTLAIYEFIKSYLNDDMCLINITHNLSDLEHLQGDYYVIEEQRFNKLPSREEAIETYIRSI